MAATLIKAATANITAQEVAASVTGLPSPALVAIQIAGTFTATVTFEVTVDGTNWVAAGFFPAATPTASVATTATGAGLFLSAAPLAVSGVRARVSAFTNNTSGVITLRVSCQ